MSITAPTPDQLRAFRAACALSQAALAARLGVSGRAVEEWEAGRRAPPAFLALALAALDQGLKPWE